MEKEQDILKSLLLKEELELLEKIRQKVLSEDQFTEEVSNVLSNAIIRAQKKNNHLQRALSEPVKVGVKNAFSDNKQTIIDALLPIMGKLIRKTVTNSIKLFVSDINRTLELAVSVKSLKWRLQAKKAGISFAEMVFQKTVRYQVEEIFLINRNNGLLIEYVGSDDMLKDTNAISGMLTAIQDFIGDSLRTSDTDSLASAEIANKQFIITSGPTAFLATVVKGSPTEKFKERSQKFIENIHAEFSAELQQEDLYRNITGLSGYLKPHLITKSIGEHEKKTNLWPWIITAFIIITSLGYWGYQRNKQFSHITDLTQSIQGLSVNNISRHESGFLIDGLLDPMADLSVLENQTIAFKTKPFISLDPLIIQKRVTSVLSTYKDINAEVTSNQVILTGLIDQQKHQHLLIQINAVPGINHVVDQLEIDNTKDIKSFVERQPDNFPNMGIQFSQNKITLSGQANFIPVSSFKNKLKKQFNEIIIDDKGLNINDSTTKLMTSINDAVIKLTDLKQSIIIKDRIFLMVVKNLQSLINRDVKISLNIIGHSDCNGASSDSYSQKRAEAIKDILLEHNIESSVLSTSINKCQSFDHAKDNSQMKVTFKVQQ